MKQKRRLGEVPSDMETLPRKGKHFLLCPETFFLLHLNERRPLPMKPRSTTVKPAVVAKEAILLQTFINASGTLKK
jgi:hypothetical protein